MFGKIRLLKDMFDVGYQVTHTKNWYTSKTIWYNILIIVTYFLANKYGSDFITKDELDLIALALSVLGNIFLRFKTRRPISVRSKSSSNSGEGSGANST